MPKVKGPLMSVAASGVYEDKMEFRIKNGNTIVAKRRTKPKGRSLAQETQQARISNAITAWNALGQAGKAAWKTTAEGSALNGYQLFLQQYIAQNCEPPAVPVLPN